MVQTDDLLQTVDLLPEGIILSFQFLDGLKYHQRQLVIMDQLEAIAIFGNQVWQHLLNLLSDQSERL